MSNTVASDNRPWWTVMTRYHWYVFTLAALGWLFDTMDGMIFTASRSITMAQLMPDASADDKGLYGGIVTSLFILGWATGGLIFGVVGDRWGRAKTMALTIFIYAAFTGLSAFSQNWWQFGVFRFLTGLGVGGEFAAGAALLSEVMPERARAKTLGWLQALSAVGNIMGAVLFWYIEPRYGWKWLYCVGAFPALLSVVVRAGLKEPEKWQAAKDKAAADAASGVAPKQMGGIAQLFSPGLRRNTFAGLALGISGVLGLWGAGFFSPELMDTSFAVVSADARTNFEKLAATEDAAAQKAVLATIAEPAALYPQIVSKHFKADPIDPKHAFSTKLSPSQVEQLKVTVEDESFRMLPETRARFAQIVAAKDDLARAALITDLNDAGTYKGIVSRRFKPGHTVKPDDALTTPLTAEQREQLKQILSKSMPRAEHSSLKAQGLIVQQIGAFFGILCYGWLAGRMGRRPAFLAAFLIAWFSVAYTFLFFNSQEQVWYLYPLLGFGTLAPFGGYALYFPELFPTRLRTTGTGFCYNVGRFVSALGPFALPGFAALLHGKSEFAGFRLAAVVMSLAYSIGIVALLWAPETKDQPLPDDERGFTH